LTPERLRQPHSSIARNHRLCEALFLARYIEKFGTGTLMMIRECAAHGLPEPGFEQRAGEFVTTVWRDWLTPQVVTELGLTERQRLIIPRLKAARIVTNSIYQTITRATRKTAARDLENLVQRGLLALRGSRRGAHYVLARKWDRKETNEPPSARQGNETVMGHLRQKPSSARPPPPPASQRAQTTPRVTKRRTAGKMAKRARKLPKRRPRHPSK
jgi:ATP-dependent DNA helicase RecG